MARALVIGLGNPILGDDGVGIRVAQHVRTAVPGSGIDVKEAAVGGLRFLEMIVDYENVIVADSIQTEGHNVGRIHRLDVRDGVSSKNICCAHDVGFFEAIALGHRLGLSMPRKITIYAIEVGACSEFTEECSPAVEAAASEVSGMICEEVLGLLETGNWKLETGQNETQPVMEGPACGTILS